MVRFNDPVQGWGLEDPHTQICPNPSPASVRAPSTGLQLQ